MSVSQSRSGIVLLPAVLFTIVLLFGNGCSSQLFAQSRNDEYRDKYRQRLREADSLALTRKRNIIKSDVLGVMSGYFNVTYERLAQRAPRSLVLTAEYDIFSYEEFDFKGVSFQPALRYYLNKNRQPPAGYYAQPFAIYSDFKVTDTSRGNSAHINQVGGGLDLGWQWVIAERLTIDTYIGGVYVETSVRGSLSHDAIRSFQPLVGVNCGFIFGSPGQR
ncbi:MAG TPA: DUF3575 domain-containing protein [Ohtaekwangia sp.]|uniref:DUF3575 domain-containing protein n=1 Tax=Ohtaekwangia sp. TaxID=2066019 RepID=UPI002F92FEE1